MKKLLLTFTFLFSALTVFSQTEVNGKVADDTGMPIAGANVIIKGSTSGAITDFDGNFSFTTSLSGEQTLQISFVGFKTFEQLINCEGNTITIDAVLTEGGNALDAVVLTASSTFRSQKDTPMSISSLKQKDITKLSANSQADILRSIH